MDHTLHARLPGAMLLSAFLLLAASLPGSSGATDPAPTPDDIEALAEAAVGSHPGLESLRSQVDALREASRSARLWSDPVLGGELSNLPVTSPTLDSHAMAGVQFKLQQRFPAPGEPAARAALADARVDEAEDAVEVAANMLRGEVRARYWDLALVRQLRVVTDDHLEQLDGLLVVVQARYEVGVAQQHDLLQLQLRRDRLAQDLADFDAREAALLAMLNGALARDPRSPVNVPTSSDVGELQDGPEARSAALASHPEVVALRARASTARAAAHRARIEARPEPTVWLGYRVRAEVPDRDPGTNFVTAGVSVPLPFASTRRWQAEELAAVARARAAEQAADGALERLRAKLAAAEARYARAAARAAAYREELGPAARATLDSTLLAFGVDRATFADLIRADIDVLDIERRRLRAETEAAVARAEIETLVRAPATPGPETSP